MNDRFKSLTGVIFNQERTTLRRAEELALVLGLAASRLRTILDEQEEQLYESRRRLALIAAVLILVLAIGGAWYLFSTGNSAALTPLIVATLIGLVLVATLFLAAPYTERFRLEADRAAVTRVAQLFWPIGILPLDGERALLFDPLTAESGAEPLGVVQLPPALGLTEEQVVSAGKEPVSVLSALSSYEDQLSAIAAEPVAWPANPADESARTLGPEVNDLWQRMAPAPEITTNAIVGGPIAWATLVAEGERLHAFYQEREGLDVLAHRYGQRAQSMVDGARATVVGYSAAHEQSIRTDRATHLQTEGAKTPTLPGEVLPLNLANQAEQIRASAATVEAALQPLDADIARVMGEWEAREQAELTALPAAHRTAQDDIELLERKIATVDSEILKLAQTLDTHQQRIVEGSRVVKAGFEAIAQTPVADLRREISQLDQAVQQANSVIEEVTPRLDLPALDVTAQELITVTERAHQSWAALAEEMPKRSEDVRWQLESVQDRLRAVADNPSTEQGQTAAVQEAVRSVERIVRGVVSWTNAQQDPISPLEDADQELAQHLGVIRDLRGKLEQASSTYAATTGQSPNGHLPALPTALERVDHSLSRFIKLVDENTAAIAALTNAADTVRKQGDLIAERIRERDALRRDLHAQQESLQRTLRDGEATIRARWQGKREELNQKRAAITPHTATLHQRLDSTLHDPFFQSAGVIADPASASWAARIARQMETAIDKWGQRVADVDADAPDGSVVTHLRQVLVQRVMAMEERAVATQLNGEAQALHPLICFIPFWYVETSDDPTQTAAERQVHVFPPLHLNQPVPTEIPTIARLHYSEISRRLLAFLRRDFRNGGDPLDALTFDPAVLSDAGKAIPVDAGLPPWQEMAAALAQQWVFFRVDDPLLNRIIENSRNYLLPTTQMEQLWLVNAQQATARPDRDTSE